MSQNEEIQKLLPYSCKLETDQKCIKISTHCYAETGSAAVMEAANMWKLCKQLLEGDGFKVAPLNA